VAVIAIFGGSYCHAEEVTAGVTGKLNLERIDEKLIHQTSERFDVRRERLERALTAPDPFLNRITHEREKNLAYLRTVLADMILPDNVVVHGCAGHLIPKTIAHVLRVCLIANFDYRVQQAVELEKMSEKEARRIIHDDDKKSFTCTVYLFDKPAYDESLYDIVIPMHDTSVDAAIDIISEYVDSQPLRTTEKSLQSARDFVLSARVGLALTESGFKVDVHSENGHVILLINEYVLRMERYKQRLTDLVSKVPGVGNITMRLGPKYSVPSINPWANIEGQPKVLLVDDEKEFVHTLSERLKTRDLESSIAYDGEQALEILKEAVPDVMVLDLMMPGIDGIEVLRRIKRDHPEVEVIILTGHGSEREKTMAQELGAFAYLQKPVNIDHLARVMREAYSKANLGQAGGREAPGQ
jgi:CheY-like chemotaxis protein/cytidylate kinase